MNIKWFIPFILLFLAETSLAQRHDTLKVMQYNLLNYRNTTPQCDAQSNDPAKKDAALSKIVKHVQPDIFAVNEMGANWLNPNKLLTNALNGSGVNYDQAEFTNNGFSSLVNMLFYNKDILGLRDQEVIEEDLSGRDLVRVIDVYHLFIKDNDALANGDTIFIDVIVAHLKAGDGTADKADRADATEAVMKYMENAPTSHNYIILGDFNVKSSSEDSYRNLVEHSDPDVRFYDPMDAPGSWSSKSLYANLHTQSTRTSSTSGGCFSGGGLDDRFDFILIGNNVRSNKNKVKYVDDSYDVVGQDSRRFNNTVVNPTNYSVPSAVAQALYDMSDHLPVTVELRVGPAFVGTAELHPDAFVNIWQANEKLGVSTRDEMRSVRLLDLSGRVVLERSVSDKNFELSTAGLANGAYTIFIHFEDGSQSFRRIGVVKR